MASSEIDVKWNRLLKSTFIDHSGPQHPMAVQRIVDKRRGDRSYGKTNGRQNWEQKRRTGERCGLINRIHCTDTVSVRSNGDMNFHASFSVFLLLLLCTLFLSSVMWCSFVLFLWTTHWCRWFLSQGVKTVHVGPAHKVLHTLVDPIYFFFLTTRHVMLLCEAG